MNRSQLSQKAAARAHLVACVAAVGALASCGPTVVFDDGYRFYETRRNVSVKEIGWQAFSADLGPRTQLYAIYPYEVSNGDRLRAELSVIESNTDSLVIYLMPHCDTGEESEFSSARCELNSSQNSCSVEHTFTASYSCIRVAFHNPTDESLEFTARRLQVDYLDVAAEDE